MTYHLHWRSKINETASIGIVGCGGTGSFLAEGLCRLLPPTYALILIDHDRVEPHNLRRQNFFSSDLGEFKSQALAERLAQTNGCEISYSVHPYTSDPMAVSYGLDLIIGCVDNAAARKALHTRRGNSWWLDAGNGRHSGQVLIGNATTAEELKEGFQPDETVWRLPKPALQQPALLIPSNEPTLPRDCAEAVRDNDQSPVINQMMAVLVQQIVYKLINNQLTWMAAYIDLDAGTLGTVPAEPEIVARMMSMKVKDLIKQPEKQRVKVKV